MGYYFNSMMGDWGTWGLFGTLIHLELLIIGALVIVWLWKRISK